MSAVRKIPATPEALRAVLAEIAPHRLTDFDEARAKATGQAREATDPTPLRIFTEMWAVEVAIEGDPDLAASLRTLEHKADVVTDIAEARDIVRQIAAIRRNAAAAAGVLPEETDR
ncbi:hypothetical protein [Streptomyces sp. NPDC001020]